MNINSIIFQYASIGDYLFLIAIVVASIIQTIVQNRKKKALQQEVSQKKNTQSDTLMPDVLGPKPETMKGYDEPVDNIFDSIKKMLVPEFEEEKHIWGDDYSESTGEEEIDKEADESFNTSEEKLMRKIEERHTELITAKPVTENKAVRYKHGIREGFSLRKAVVYSEILNRKYT